MTVVTSFHDLLALDRVGEDRFTTVVPGAGGHLFGGLTFALAIAAATRTVDGGRGLTAATCQYLGAGQGGLDLGIEVERVRDGGQVTLRRARVVSADRVLFTCDAWFSPEGEGTDWQPSSPPDDLEASRPVELQYGIPIDPLEARTLRSPADAAGLRLHPFWARSRVRLGEDPSVHAGALAFLSDTYTVGLMNPPGVREDAPMSAYSLTLNLDLWVHRPVRLDDWVRVDGELASLHGERGLATGAMHTRDGRLVASFAQEAMRRRLPDARDRRAPPDA